MQTARVTWELPTEKDNGRPLDLDDIDRVEVLLSANQGQDFSALDPVRPEDEQVSTIPDLEDGDWVVRLVVFDTRQRSGDNVDTPFTIDTAPPGTVKNVNVELS